MIQPYSKKLMKHFRNPKFVKEIKNPDGVGEVGNITCGDVMLMKIKVADDWIKDIGFQTFGCPAAVASSDIVCELAKGKTLKQAKKLKKEDVVKELGGMPPIKVHCSVLGIQALKKAIEDYEHHKGVTRKSKILLGAKRNNF